MCPLVPESVHVGQIFHPTFNSGLEIGIFNNFHLTSAQRQDNIQFVWGDLSKYCTVHFTYEISVQFLFINSHMPS